MYVRPPQIFWMNVLLTWDSLRRTNTTGSISSPYHKHRILWRTLRDSELAHLWNGLIRLTERGCLNACVCSGYEIRGQRNHFTIACVLKLVCHEEDVGATTAALHK